MYSTQFPTLLKASMLTCIQTDIQTARVGDHGTALKTLPTRAKKEIYILEKISTQQIRQPKLSLNTHSSTIL